MKANTDKDDIKSRIGTYNSAAAMAARIEPGALERAEANLQAVRRAADRLAVNIARHEAAIIRMQTTLNRPSWFKRLFLSRWWH